MPVLPLLLAAILPSDYAGAEACAKCHAAEFKAQSASAHAHALAKSKSPQPGDWALGPGNQANDFSGSCHRMRMGAAATPDLRKPWNARHQPLLLAASRCFRESRGKLSCLTCHSPHAPLDQNLAAYDATCAGCHTSPKH